MTGMRTIRYNNDIDRTTVYECPVCLKRETAWSKSGLQHEVGGIVCLQRQVTALQMEVTAIIEKLGGIQ